MLYKYLDTNTLPRTDNTPQSIIRHRPLGAYVYDLVVWDYHSLNQTFMWDNNSPNKNIKGHRKMGNWLKNKSIDPSIDRLINRSDWLKQKTFSANFMVMITDSHWIRSRPHTSVCEFTISIERNIFIRSSLSVAALRSGAVRLSVPFWFINAEQISSLLMFVSSCLRRVWQD